ncbi:carbon starvation protein A [Thermobifida halotolerans]|uniref:Carbon starvation protein A n=1 Tax=Thermobifida halotolerans TaxID=483545 RepID=A0A399G5K7_9ACTN|nr:carbon starvation protein A [Thermobifida halotolerans]UOE20520.1 carbon starvation protein A [Thermobifida halotolerans]
MPAVVVLVAVLALFALGYRYYSTYLTRRVYALDPNYVTPAHRYSDGVDFVPTNKHVLFSHHFISVAGAAPIVGPAVAVFWGWGPALLWVLLGTIFAAGAHDLGALAVSVRHRAKSIGTLAGEVVGRRASVLFLLIIFFLLTLINAVFSVVIANLFVANPSAVLPVLVTIPLAIGVGQYVYRTRTAALLPSLVVLLLIYASIPLGLLLPITLDPLAAAVGLTPKTLWIVLIFGYAFVASRLPVWLLLQPRDYVNQQQMLVALAVILLGVAVGLNTIAAPVVNDVPEGSPPWFPLLFITVACGAISGFHSLVASGTTAKQLDKETDARYVGYMGALGEGTLALCAILACTAGVAATRADWNALYPDYATASGGATGNFVNGVAAFAGNIGIPETVGVIFAAVVVISFASTTMDTGVRLQRYIIQEIAEIARIRPLARNLTLATSVAVVVPLALALIPGDFAFGTLWQLFGTTNQLTAGLALAVIAVWVTKNSRNPLAVLVPLVFLLVMTSWALVVNLVRFATAADPVQAFLLAPLDAVIFVLALWLIVEAALALRRAWAARAERPAAEGAEAGAAEEKSTDTAEAGDR